MRADRLSRLLPLVAVIAAAGCDIIHSPTTPDANWTIASAGRFTFYARPDSFAAQHVNTFTEVLEDQFASTVSRLRLAYSGHVTVYMYSSGADAGFASDAGGGDHSGVAYPQTETVKAAVVPPLDGNLFVLLSHELNHVILHNGLGRPGTSLLNEGLAQAMVSERYHSLGPTFAHRWTAGRLAQVPALADMADDERWRGVPEQMAYTAGASFLSWLLERRGPELLVAIYSAESRDFQARVRAVYGSSLEDLEAQWRAFLATVAVGP